ncbi:MAG: GNAT family N-acetyltransferase, partial [Alphaproteobacteria bacterium]|nr:GNAT family N-acetyltransferase [Alphaproteobacteria bacterium]
HVTATFRPPDAAQAEALASRHVQCWRESYAGLLDPDFLRDLTVEYRARIWRRALADPAMFLRVTEVAGERVGFVMAGPASPDYRQWAACEVHALYLRRHRQGQGLGRSLLSEALGNLKGRGAAGAVAMVFAENHGARRFYEALGGQEAGSLPITLGAMNLIEIAYVFDLARPAQ